MTELLTYYYPRSLEEALAVLQSAEKPVVLVAGGTSAALRKWKDVRSILDLGRAGLDGIAGEGACFRIGACATASAIARSGIVQRAGAAALGEAARAAGSQLIRNAVTVGGNVVQGYSWSDLPVPLIALGGSATLRSPEGARSIAVDEFLTKHPRRILQEGELVVDVTVPVPPERAGAAFLTYTQTAVDFAILSVATFLRLEEGSDQIAEARVAVGAIVPLARRVPEAEANLTGAVATEETFAAAAAAASEAIQPRPDPRVSESYAREMLGVYVRRCLAISLTRARERRAAASVEGVEAPARVSIPPDRPWRSGEPLRVVVDGVARELCGQATDNLLDVLRANGFTCVKRGCDEGDCGACAVLVDGVPLQCCMLLAGQAAGRRLTTVWGVGDITRPHPIQLALVEEGAVQCGFCTPGVVVSAKALLDERPEPTAEEIKEYLDGNLCRCTGYVKIIRAVERAAALLREGATEVGR